MRNIATTQIALFVATLTTNILPETFNLNDIKNEPIETHSKELQQNLNGHHPHAGIFGCGLLGLSVGIFSMPIRENASGNDFLIKFALGMPSAAVGSLLHNINDRSKPKESPAYSNQERGALLICFGSFTMLQSALSIALDLRLNGAPKKYNYLDIFRLVTSSCLTYLGIKIFRQKERATSALPETQNTN